MDFPMYTETEARPRETFLALMWALSYPGRIQYLPDSEDGFRLIAEALLDLETSYYTPDNVLKNTLAYNGSQALPVEQAAYHFYASIKRDDMARIKQASVGTMLYPDTAATLVIGCRLGSGTQVVVQGPGVRDQQAILVDDLPDTFWDLRAAVCRFPLGWDLYLMDGQQVVGIPRGVRTVLV